MCAPSPLRVLYSKNKQYTRLYANEFAPLPHQILARLRWCGWIAGQVFFLVDRTCFLFNAVQAAESPLWKDAKQALDTTTNTHNRHKTDVQQTVNRQ